jgi:dTDP-4-amino-4,6-dideoxygalactose transaminase
MRASSRYSVGMGSTVSVGDLKRQVAAIRSEIDAAIADVLDSGWFVLGPQVEAFEREFAAYCGTRHAIGVASGAEALYLALVALGVGTGDEVITVANACTYQAAAIVQTGASPVFVDVTEDHLIDPLAVESACSSRTKAILPVHLYGRLAPMPEIGEVAEKFGVPVVEDAAQAHGAFLADRVLARQRAGAWGTIGCFSFYPSKNLGAFGDGGALTTDDDQLAAKLRRLRMYGWEHRYVVGSRGGRNSRLDELQAAILRVKLKHVEEWTEARRLRARWYRELIHVDGVRLPLDVDGHVYHLYVVTTEERDEFRRRLAERGIATDVHYPTPAHRQRALCADPPPAQLPVTDHLSRRICSLPMFPELTREEIEAVAQAVNEVGTSLSLGARGAARP